MLERMYVKKDKWIYRFHIFWYSKVKTIEQILDYVYFKKIIFSLESIKKKLNSLRQGGKSVLFSYSASCISSHTLLPFIACYSIYVSQPVEFGSHFATKKKNQHQTP